MKRTVLLLAGALLMFAAAAPAAWEGEITETDGVTTVANPESPAMGVVQQVLEEKWRRGGDDDEIFFGTIGEFLHDADGNIYLLDGQLSEIQVFDPDGEHLRTIGRQGEGPGEFQNGADMFWAPGGEIGVVQAWPGKVVLITPEGDPGPTFSLPYREGGGFQSVTRAAGHDGAIIMAGTAWTREEGKQIQFTYLKSYDAGGNEVAPFVETSKEVQFGDYEFIEQEYVDFQRRWAVAPDGRVAAALSFEDYRIHVWKADGTVDRIIERPGYEKVKRDGAEKARFQTMFEGFTRWNRGSTFKVSEDHQAIGQMFFREDGTLWVQSGVHQWRAGEGVYTSFDVYDTMGRFQQQVDLIADADAVDDGLFLVGGNAYVVTDLWNAVMARFAGGEGEEDDEAEPVEVVAYRFEPVVAAGP